MTTEKFNDIINRQIEHCESILCSKAKEYATADRLHNFKVAGALQGVSPVQALMGMMAKHTVSVADMCMSGETYPQELWDEKITDSINYLLLLSALVRESFGYNRCIYCSADYQPYAISPHEAQIKGCGKICKDCLVRMPDEKLRRNTMDKIKFRAWDKISGKVRIIDSIAFDKQGEIKVINVWGYNLIEQKETIIHLANKKELERIVLMQFTGLKDKNGDEIYSGHIVNFLGMVGEIIFDSGAFGIVFDCIDWDLIEYEMRKYTGCNNPLNFCCNDNFISLWEIYWNFNEEENSLGIVEIIGDMFGNPELLEENNE